MDRKKLAKNLIIVSILILAPVFFISYAFPMLTQVIIYTCAAIGILILVIGLIYVRKDLRVHSARAGWVTARTPLGVEIAIILTGLFCYYTNMLGYSVIDFIIPPQAMVQATLVLILALSSAIITLIAAIVYPAPKEPKRSSTWT